MTKAYKGLWSDSVTCLCSYGGGTAAKSLGGSTSPNIHNPLYPPATIPSAPPGDQMQNHSNSADSSQRRAKVLYDYDAADMSELSLVADEVNGLLFFSPFALSKKPEMFVKLDFLHTAVPFLLLQLGHHGYFG